MITTKNGLLDDGNGNYLFIHYGRINGSKILPSMWGKNSYTSDNRSVGVSYYYTNLHQRETMVSGDPYVVKVPYDRVYFFNRDPENFYKTAYNNFKDEYPGSAFSAPRQLDYMHPLIAAAGYDMVVAKWNGGYRGETTKPLVYDKTLTSNLQQYGTLDVTSDIYKQEAKRKILNILMKAANSQIGQKLGLTDKIYANKKINLSTLLTDPYIKKLVGPKLLKQYEL